jgi:geranylgeranyl diphosphate synthase, type I
VLTVSGHPAAEPGTELLSAAVLELIGGQQADLALEQRSAVTLAECLAMVAGKTGALLGAATALGACCAGGRPNQVAHLRRFGMHLGVAFQHIDDLLGIWGDPRVTGKPAYADLQRRKKSLPVVAALHSGTAAGEQLAALYRRHQPLSATDLAQAAELVERAGGRAWSQNQATELLDAALAELDAAEPASQAAVELAALARRAVHRDR